MVDPDRLRAEIALVRVVLTSDDPEKLMAVISRVLEAEPLDFRAVVAHVCDAAETLMDMYGARCLLAHERDDER